jgi:5'-nucleotidase
MVIAIDVDGVVFDLVSEVLRRYNKDWDDHLAVSDITQWDVSKFAKPECGVKIYEYFEMPDAYEQALPVQNAYHGLLEIAKDGHRIVFVTTAAPGTAGVKQHILSDYGYLKDRKNYVECADKSLIKADVLVDDGIHNLRHFSGERVIFDQPWNRHESIGGAWRAKDWEDVVKIIRAINKGI